MLSNGLFSTSSFTSSSAYAVEKAQSIKNINAILNIDAYLFNNENYKHELGLEFDYKKHAGDESELWSLILGIMSGESRAEMSANIFLLS